MGLVLAGLDARPAREVHRHHGRDVRHTEARTGNDFAIDQPGVERKKEGVQPGQATLRRLGDLRIAERPGQGTTLQRRRVLRSDAAVAVRPSNSVRQFQVAISTFCGGMLPSSGGSGYRASGYAAMATLSPSTLPLQRRSAGTVHSGLMARKASPARVVHAGAMPAGTHAQAGCRRFAGALAPLPWRRVEGGAAQAPRRGLPVYLRAAQCGTHPVAGGLAQARCHLIEQPMLACCGLGARPLAATCCIAS